MAFQPIKLAKEAKIKEFQQMLIDKLPEEGQARGIEELKKLGIQGVTTVEQVKDANGNPVYDKNGNPVTRTVFTATHTPAYYMKAIPILNGVEPCYFEGCEEIVAAYNKELAAEGGPACTHCKKGQLLRKYLLEIRNALPPEEVNKIAQPSIPPRIVKNMRTGETKVFERKTVPYATIRRVVPDYLKKAFTSEETERKLFMTTYGENGQITGITELPGPDEGGSA